MVATTGGDAARRRVPYWKRRVPPGPVRIRGTMGEPRLDFSDSQGRWSKEERIHTLTAGRLLVQEMQCLDQRAEDLLKRARQRQTNELYAGWLEELECFAGAVGIGRALPASTKLVCRFLCFFEMTGSAAATGAGKSAISAWHSDRDLSDPCKANSVKQVLKGAARVAAESRRESRAIGETLSRWRHCDVGWRNARKGSPDRDGFAMPRWSLWD